MFAWYKCIAKSTTSLITLYCVVCRERARECLIWRVPGTIYSHRWYLTLCNLPYVYNNNLFIVQISNTVQ